MVDLTWKLMLSLLLVTLVFHILVLIMLYKPKRKTCADLLLFSAYVSNILYMIVVCLDIVYLYKLNQNEVAYPMLFFINYKTTVLTALTVQKYVAVFHPLRLRIWVTKSKTKKFLIITFIGLLVIYVGLRMCVWQKLFTIRQSFIALAFGMSAMFITISILNFLIFAKFAKNVITKRHQRENRVSRNTRTTVLAFFITALSLVSYIPITLRELGLSEIGMLQALILLWLDQILSSVLYIFMNFNYKWFYKQMKRCQTKLKRNVKIND